MTLVVEGNELTDVLQVSRFCLEAEILKSRDFSDAIELFRGLGRCVGHLASSGSKMQKPSSVIFCLRCSHLGES